MTPLSLSHGAEGLRCVSTGEVRATAAEKQIRPLDSAFHGNHHPRAHFSRNLLKAKEVFFPYPSLQKN